MLKVLTASVMLAVVACACAFALWAVPPADPLDYIRFQLTHHATETVGVTEAEASRLCPPDMTWYHAQCVDHLTHPHFAAWQSRSRFLSEVQTIPDDDCARMAAALIDRLHLRDDGQLVKNARGGFNCDFSRGGLAHFVRPAEASGGQCSPTYDVNIPLAMSASDYDVCVRKTYVTRPVYNLSRTRYSIVAGNGPDGSLCIYTRIDNRHLTRRWRLESCPETWSF